MRFSLPLLVVLSPISFTACELSNMQAHDEAAHGRDPTATPVAEVKDELDSFAEEIERLNAVGYSAAVAEPHASAGVVRNNPERTWDGYNFYVSAHRPEAVLMDMDGGIVHTWHYPFSALRETLGDRIPAKQLNHGQSRPWRRAWLYPNGDVLAIHENLAMVKVNRDSELMWVYPQGTHHDMQVVDNGEIYVLSHESRLIPSVNPEEMVRDDLIVVLAPDGTEKKAVSILECVVNSGRAELIAKIPKQGDLFHTNTLHVLDRSHVKQLPAFTEGRVLVSLLMLHTVVLIDLDKTSVVWTLEGEFRFQHEPHVLDTGNILLFDNFGPALRGMEVMYGNDAQAAWYNYIFDPDLPKKRGSAVLEINPANGSVVWRFERNESNPFFSKTCGTAQRLPNGNTLITESEGARSFEVTSSGEIVWEFRSSHRIGGKAARLFDLQRIEESRVAWLPETDATVARTQPDSVVSMSGALLRGLKAHKIQTKSTTSPAPLIDAPIKNVRGL